MVPTYLLKMRHSQATDNGRGPGTFQSMLILVSALFGSCQEHQHSQKILQTPGFTPFHPQTRHISLSGKTVNSNLWPAIGSEWFDRTPKFGICHIYPLCVAMLLLHWRWMLQKYTWDQSITKHAANHREQIVHLLATSQVNLKKMSLMQNELTDAILSNESIIKGSLKV